MKLKNSFILKLSLIFVGAAFLFIHNSGAAEQENNLDLDSFSKKLKEKMSGISSISFRLEQDTFIATSTHSLEADIDFKRPDKYFIKYSKPQVQQIIIDGEALVTYIPEIKQATSQIITEAGSFFGVTASLLFSDDPIDNMKKLYNLKFFYEKNGQPAVYANSKDIKNLEYIYIYFNSKSLLPEKTVVTAPDFKSVAIMSRYVLNPVYDAELFHFNELGIDILKIK